MGDAGGEAFEGKTDEMCIGSRTRVTCSQGMDVGMFASPGIEGSATSAATSAGRDMGTSLEDIIDGHTKN